jgi:hypothetical protein
VSIVLARGLQWGSRALRDIAAIAPGPLPWPKAARTGLSLGLAFLPLAAAGWIQEAVMAALFANLLIFIDQAGPLNERLAVLATGAVVCGAAGTLGALLIGHELPIALATFAFGLGAGLIHSWVPGVEMIPRQALICFIACAYLPLVNLGTAAGAAYGACCGLAGALADGLIRQRADSLRLQEARRRATLPGFRFGLLYASVILAGLLIGAALGIARSYWVAITVLVVMQREKRASLLRAVQRLLGTLAGVILAYLVVLVLDPVALPPAFLAVILALPFLWPLGFARNYGLAVMLLSIWVLLLIDLVLPPGETPAGILLARLSDTAIGCALAIGGTMLGSTRPIRKPG